MIQCISNIGNLVWHYFWNMIIRQDNIFNIPNVTINPSAYQMLVSFDFLILKDFGSQSTIFAFAQLVFIHDKASLCIPKFRYLKYKVVTRTSWSFKMIKTYIQLFIINIRPSKKILQFLSTFLILESPLW